jgi:hypothetical protein
VVCAPRPSASLWRSSAIDITVPRGTRERAAATVARPRLQHFARYTEASLLIRRYVHKHVVAKLPCHVAPTHIPNSVVAAQFSDF